MDYETYARTFCEYACLAGKAEDGGGTVHLAAGGDRGAAVAFSTAEERFWWGYLKLMGLSPGRVTNILNMLEKRGYIEREHDGADRRKVYVALTKSGGKHLREKYEETIRYISGIFEELGEEDTREYLRITGQIHRITEKMREERNRGKENDKMLKLLRKFTPKEWALSAVAFVLILIQVWLTLTMPDICRRLPCWCRRREAPCRIFWRREA